jgi:regulator of protease activity HflC (stomatin/prohibitin superfamily)
MRSAFILAALAAGSILSTGCVHAALVQPGHRGILFDPTTGLKHEVLPPGYYHLAGMCKELKCPRVDDFDVTYSTSKEQVKAHSSEGLGLDTTMAIVYRPVISELYELDTEVGPNYYDEVVGHEVRSACIGVLSRHSYTELRVHNREIEDEIEKETRDRIKGKHVEIDSITLQIDYAPEIEQAMRAKAVGEQEATRQKAFIENEALKNKLQLEHAAEQARLKAEADARQTELTNQAELSSKQHELEVAKEQAAIDKVAGEGAITRAKAQSEEMRLLAKGQAEKNRAESLSISPLMVQMHAYDALGQLGGKGTNIMLGDWSRVPNFLFPHYGAMPAPFAPSSYSNDAAPPPPAVIPATTKVEDKKAKSSPGF